MKLTDCLKKHDILPEDVEMIRALQKDYLADGMAPEQAAVTAIESVIAEVEAEKTQLVDRIVNEGGDVAEYFQGGRTVDVAETFKREKKSGRFVGAPDWVGNDPKNVEKLHELFIQLAHEGDRGRYWYENSSKAILQIASNDPVEAEKIVGLIALYSPNATVAANTTMALTAYYQHKAGVPINAGFGVADRKAQALMDEGKFWQGIKTNSFYQNLMVEIDPSKLDPGVATMDMWMAIAADYGMKSLDQGPKYRFMETLVNNVSKELGWLPHQVQAAVWTATKARIDPYQSELKAAEIKRGIAKKVEKKVKGRMTTVHEVLDKKEHFHLAHKMGMLRKYDRDDVEWSKYDFSDAIFQRNAQMSWEAIPGEESNVLPGIHNAPLHQKIEYLEAMNAALRDESGADLIGKGVGLAIDREVEGFSGWKGVTNVGIQDGISVPNLNGVVKPFAKTLINLAADIRGMLLSQEGVGWHYPNYNGGKYGQNGIEFQIGRLLSNEETEALYRDVSKELGHTFSPPIPTSDGAGIRFLNFPDEKFELMGVQKLLAEKQSPAQTKKLKAKARKLQGILRKKNDEFHVKIVNAISNQEWYNNQVPARFESDGELRENDWSNGDVDYRGRITATAEAHAGQYGGRWAGSSDIWQWIENDLRPRVEQVNKDFTERYGWDKPQEVTYFQSDQIDSRVKQDARGSIKFIDDKAVISLFEDADLSTFLHESGHFFLEAMRSFAQESPEIKADLDILMKWFGDADHNQALKSVKSNVKAAEAKAKKTGETADISTAKNMREALNYAIDNGGADLMKQVAITFGENIPDQYRTILFTPYHEQFARGFEAYLFEGKSPNLELQGIFDRFRQFIIEAYKGIKNVLPNLNVKLTDEVRGVMDRLVATEEQIDETLIADQYKPLFESQEDAGMTANQWKEYQELNSLRRAEGLKELQHRSVADMKLLSNAVHKNILKQQKANAAKRKEVKAEVTEEVYQTPVYAVRRFLTHGEITIKPKNREQRRLLTQLGMEKTKLSLPALKEMYGNDPAALWRYFSPGKYGMVAKEGIDPDDVAQLFGFSSGDALVRDLLAAVPPEQHIEQLTDERMLERYGDITSPEAMDRAAQEAVANDAHARFVATELRQLNKAVGGLKVLASAAKAFTNTAIGRKKVRNIKPAQYRAAEARAAKASLKAMGKGDQDAAAQHKRAQVLNVHFERAARNGVEEIEKAVRYLKKFDSEGTRKNLDSDYLDQIDSLLERFDLRKSTSLKEIERRKSLLEWVKSKEDEDVIIDEFLLDKARKQSYKDMTLDELRGLRDSVKNIEHLGRLKKRLLNAKDKREFDLIMSELKVSMEEHANRIVELRGEPADRVEELSAAFRGFAAEHRKMASFLREFDGGNDGGPWWTAIGMPGLEAANKELELNMEAIDKIAEIFDKVNVRYKPGGVKVKKDKIPGTNISLSDEQRIMVGVYQGEAGNRQRLLDGGIYTSGVRSQSEVDAVLDTLTKDEWNTVQAMLDLAGSYRDQVAALEKRITGREPEWLDPAPIATKYGVYPGGYFPAKYDRGLSDQAMINEAKSDLRLMTKAAFHSATTSNSYVQKRAAEVKDRPLRLSFNTLSDHISEVTHRLAYEEWIHDTNKILKAAAGDIRQYYGNEVLEQLRATVNDVATGDIQARDWGAKTLNHLRMGSTIVGLGYRFTTAAIQVAGLAQSVVRVGPRYIGKGVSQFAKNPIQTVEMVNEKSVMMKNRGLTFMREINEAMGVIRDGKKMSVFKASFFWAIGKMQKSVDIPTWIGAYEKGLADLGYEAALNEAEREAIDQKAVLLADQAVKDSQSHGQLIDLAKIQRGPAYKKIWSVFYSYFSATYNLNVESYRKTHFKNPIEFGEFLANFMILNTFPVLFSTLMYEALRPECDDMECFAKKFAADHVRYMMGMMVYVRELGSLANVVSDDPVWDYRGPAGAGFFGEAITFGKQASQLEIDAPFLKSANKLSGTILHYPAGQINNTIEGIVAAENGDVEGVGILQAILAGPPK